MTNCWQNKNKKFILNRDANKREKKIVPGKYMLATLSAKKRWQQTLVLLSFLIIHWRISCFIRSSVYETINNRMLFSSGILQSAHADTYTPDTHVGLCVCVCVCVCEMPNFESCCMMVITLKLHNYFWRFVRSCKRCAARSENVN